MGFGRNKESDASPSDSRDPIDENVDDPDTDVNQKCQSFDKLESTLPIAATCVKGNIVFISVNTICNFPIF